jgi:hypothetical protein
MRTIAYVGVGVFVALLLAVLLLWVFQRRLIYLPDDAVPDVRVALPGATEVQLETSDGLTLSAWFIAPEAGGERTTVVVFPGNGGNRGGRTDLARGLANRGYGVLLVDYRGYGGNPGKPSEQGLIADGEAAIRFLRSHPDADPDRLLYLGESLGSGVAIAVASEHEPLALVLRSPFTSLTEVAAIHSPIPFVGWLLWDSFPNEDLISAVNAPVLVIAGTADRTVPMDQSRRVFDAAPGRKRMVVVEGADHNDPSLGYGKQLIDSIAEFIRAR